MGNFKLRITGDLGFEVWVDIPGYEGLYQVSTYGRIRSLDHYGHFGKNLVLYKGKILVPNVGKSGYADIMLYPGRKRVTIHRLVAEAFVPNYNGKREVNHKDENKLSNVCWNLEFLSSKENANYGTRNERIARSKKLKKVMMFDLEGNFIKEFKNVPEAAKTIGGKKCNIVACCNNRQKTAYGYKWLYE